MDELMESINGAEERAAEIRAEASAEAARIADKARADVEEIEARGAAKRAQYAHDETVKGNEAAAKDYESEMARYGREAEEFVAGRSDRTERAAQLIVGRISRGDC